MRGGMEAIYDDVKGGTGFSSFAPLRPALGSAFSARRWVGRPGDAAGPAPVPENELGSL